MAGFVALGHALGLLIGWRAWWLPPGLLWLALSSWGLHERGAALGWLVFALVAFWWWPPFCFLRSRGGMGGDVQKRINAESRVARREREAKEAAKRARREVVSFGAEPPPRQWVVPDVAPWGPRPRWRTRWHWIPVWRDERGFVTAVYGSAGTGKSYLLLDLAIAALTGGAWLGLPVTRVRNVLYVDAELDIDTMRERAWQIARGRGLSRPPGPSHWWQRPAAWLRPWGLHYLSLPVSIATEEGHALVRRHARACQADLIAFDSLTIGSGGVALADADGWNVNVSGMEQWGRPVVCIDHQPKTGKGQVGSFMKTAKIRGALELERHENGDIGVEHAKPQFGKKLPDWTVRPRFDPEARSVRFDALDAQGQPVVAPAPAPPKGKRWGPKEQAVLACYTERGPCVPAVIQERLAPLVTPDDVWRCTQRLCAAGALVEAGRVPPANGRGRPAVRYAVPGQLPVPDAAVAQAEELLRERREEGDHRPGGQGGVG